MRRIALHRFTWTGWLSVGCIILAGLLACNKEGTLVAAPDVTILGITFNSAKANMQYSAWLDGVKIADSVSTGRRIDKTIIRSAAAQHIAVKGLDGTTIIDTTLNFAKPAAEYIYLDLDASATGTGKPQLIEAGGATSTIHPDSCRLAVVINLPRITEPVDIVLYQYDLAMDTISQTPAFTFHKVVPNQLSGFGTLLYNSASVGYAMLVRYSRNGELVPGILNNTGLYNDPDRYLNAYITPCAQHNTGVKTNVTSIVRLLEDSDYFFTGCVTVL